MQTFLPYPDFQSSMLCLDDRRLGKQRVEALQILNALSKGSGGWYNHPAVKMWKGYKAALGWYMNEAILEWQRRGFKNTMKLAEPTAFTALMPSWLGDRDFHDSHRSNLLRKNFDHYAKFNWNVSSDLPYIWPM